MTPDSVGDLPAESNFTAFTLEDTEQSVSARFETMALRHPDRVAICLGTRRVTYRELLAEIDRIARAVVGARGPHSEPVALLLGDDVAMVATIFAVLRAGKFFVPLDPAQPDARATLVLEDAGAALLVTDSHHLARARSLAANGVDVLNIDTLEHAPPGDPPAAVSPDAPAYILYTSGSTGRPKGVLQGHRNILHNTFVHTNALRISPRDRLTLLSSRGTGQAMTGIFSALLNGAALHPFDLREKGLTGLAAWLVEDEITVYHSSATVFRELADTVHGEIGTSSLRVVKLGSEPVSRKDVERFKERFPRGCIFVNALSSTETGTICQNLFEHGARIEGDVVPVGHPVPDVEVRLADDEGKPVAAGEIGEICVRSRYLALGYWNNPDLTKEVFIPDRDDPSVRVFHTGDLGRIAPDGALECLGRSDNRVKIRGNRVETAEVEGALLGVDAVKQVAVVERDDGRGGKRLVAFVVLSQGAPAPGMRALREFLGARLPRHMVPSAFVFLDALPRTPGGKVDRKALPRWQPVRTPGAPSPRDLLETQLAGIWEELLGVEGITIGDDFFDLGGDSLLAVEMAIRVEQACGVNVPLQDMINELTIEKLAKLLVDRDAGSTGAPLFEVQSGGSKQPFFFAHGAIASDGFYCRNLARGLGADRPFYVIHPHGLDGKPVPRTIEEMAADRLDALLAVQPGGPYLLGGFCAGGAIVFEMARRLRERDQRVDLVVLIDTHAKNASFRAWNNFVTGFSAAVRIQPPARRRLFLRGRTFLSGLRRAAEQGVLETALFLLKKPYSVAKGTGVVKGAPLRGPLDARQAVWLKYHDALEEYVPKPYSGRVVLFRSSHLEDRTPGDFFAGWQHVCDSFDVVPIAGDHRTCVTTHVDELAAKMRSCLDALV